MTKDIHDRLSKYENILKSAVKSSYARVMDGEMKDIASIYKEHYGVALTSSQMSCSHCKLKALQRIGTDYFNYVEPKKRGRKSGMNSPVSDNQ